MRGFGCSAHFYTGRSTGKVKAEQKKNSASEKMRNFLYPYGEKSTIKKECKKRKVVIAPLRGLYYVSIVACAMHIVIAPLRGSHLRPLWRRDTNLVLAPLRGSHLNPLDHVALPLVLAPLRGSHTKYITTHRKKEEPEGWKMFTLL